MSGLFNLQKKLDRSKPYRESWAASVVKRLIPVQLRVLRKQREWSQARLAQESKVTQGVISRAEDPDYGNLTMNTLVRLAAGFDCAFIGRFVPFSELGRWYANLEDEKALEVDSFGRDTGFIERISPSAAVESRLADTGEITPQPMEAVSASRGAVIQFPSADHLQQNLTTQTTSAVAGNAATVFRQDAMAG
jgi:transcriptional regulator with XRE-family HTH domain